MPGRFWLKYHPYLRYAPEKFRAISREYIIRKKSKYLLAFQSKTLSFNFYWFNPDCKFLEKFKDFLNEPEREIKWKMAFKFHEPKGKPKLYVKNRMLYDFTELSMESAISYSFPKENQKVNIQKAERENGNSETLAKRIFLPESNSAFDFEISLDDSPVWIYIPSIEAISQVVKAVSNYLQRIQWKMKSEINMIKAFPFNWSEAHGQLLKQALRTNSKLIVFSFISWKRVERCFGLSGKVKPLVYSFSYGNEKKDKKLKRKAEEIMEIN